MTGATYTPDLSLKLSDRPPKPCCSIINEFKTVYSHHSLDWFGYEAFNRSPRTRSTVIVASLYTWSFSFLTSASFGLLFQTDTSVWGVGTSFLSGGATGLFMSLVGGQPLVLYGQTGPIVLLYVYCYEFAHENSIPFHGFVAWMGVWSAIMHWAIAIAGLNDTKYLDYVTRFTGEIFELLVAADYITAGIIGFYNNFTTKSCSIPSCSLNPPVNYLNGVFNLLLGLCFFDFAVRMQGADKGGISFGTYKVRRSLSQFGCIISLFIITLLSYAPQWDRVTGWPNPGIPARVNVQPSTWGNPRLDLSLGVSEMGNMNVGPIFGAFIPAILLTVLFYVDQNLSTLMAVRNHGELKSKPAYNMDFFLLGVTVLVTGLLGLPASSGLIPQNPMHSKALTITPTDPNEKPYVIEQRISNIIHSGLLLLILLLLPLVSYIPTGVLWGAFFLLSVEASGAQFVRRVLLFFTSEKSKNLPGWDDLREIIDNVPGPTINYYTAIQFLLWAVIFVTAVILKIPYPMNDDNTWVIIGSLFPVMIVLCAVWRFTIFRKIIPDEYLDILDPHETHGRLQEMVDDPNQEKDPDLHPQSTPSGPSSSSSSSSYCSADPKDEKDNQEQGLTRRRVASGDGV